MSLVTYTKKGFYCPQADLYIDPWRPVKRAVITHAHADHCRVGHKSYLAHVDSVPAMRYRFGAKLPVKGLQFGEEVSMNGVKISLHPAGHIIGSAQVRLEYKGEVWVVSGDYKTQDDGFAAAFEPVPCHHFISECTFGLPVFKWQDQEIIKKDILDWHKRNIESGLNTILVAYSLGKAQRLLHLLQDAGHPFFAHKAIHETTRVLRNAGIALPETKQITNNIDKAQLKGSFILIPPAALDSAWQKKIEPASVGIASGWMAIRGMRRWRSADKGFALSDHADWPGLNEAIKATGAETVYLTHGYTDIFSKYLREQGLDCRIVETEFSGNDLDQGEAGE
jgi:putative mRNA 3-end processing factor